MSDEKLAKVDTNETDVEKGPVDDGSVKKTSAANANTRSTRKVEIDTGEELVRFRRHWWQIW